MLHNCRNCKYAIWEKSISGRQLYHKPGRCVYQVQVPAVPLSFIRLHSSALQTLSQPRIVASTANTDIGCDVWMGVEK
jgi:hypothetical protein